MSPVPWNRTVAPVCALLGGTGLARVPAGGLSPFRRCSGPALPPHASMRMVCEAADPLASSCTTVC
jgi:hypothetical protein